MYYIYYVGESGESWVGRERSEKTSVPDQPIGETSFSHVSARK